jgi:S-adenosylmethionine decarboxylase
MTNLDIPNMGCHLILDFHNTSVDMNNFDELNKNFRRIIIDSGATIENIMYKKFEPQGLSILYLLSESHFSIHTWPEFGACAIDFYHCGETARQRMIKAEELLCDYLGWDNCTGSMIIDRGSYNYALITQNEHSSILYKKHKLLNRFKTETGETRVYQNEALGKLLAIDGLIQMGFHNITNLGTLFADELSEEETHTLPLTVPIKDKYFKDDSFDPKKVSDKFSFLTDSTSNNLSDFFDSDSEKDTEKRILIIGTGDLSLPVQMIKQGYAKSVVVLDGDLYHNERLKGLISNNKDLDDLLNSKKITFVSDQSEILNKKFGGIIVINKKFKPKNIIEFLLEKAFYSEICMKEEEFDEVCNIEGFSKRSFHQLSNTITRFLIGKARYS